MDSGKMNTDSPISRQTTSFNQPSGNRQTSILPDMQDCTLCPRECHADRTAGQTGFCGQSEQIMAARAALHFWEEPCLSGTNGSGTVFFSGCNLRCVYCQNHTIAQGQTGKGISIERL